MNNIPSPTFADELPKRPPWPFPEPLPGRLLGIDAGGSATRVVLVADGRIARRFTAPPMNALLTVDLTDRLATLIATAGDTGHNTGHNTGDATAAGIGLPGLRSPDDAAALGAELTRRAGLPVRVAGDGETAWLGAFGAAPGIVVYAGTGSGGMGCDGERWARAGGHGFLLGDEGSAYWIGRAAANAALRWEDGMGGSAALRDAVIEASGGDLAALIGNVNSHPAERGRLALLAPVVTALAGEDDAARRIALEAAEHLTELARAVRRRLGPLPVSGLGGVLRAPVIWDRFAELTGAVPPMAAPEMGAALLAGRGRVC
jgi:N-acetylglucosamine kinase-like BadF-type ATPase